MSSKLKALIITPIAGGISALVWAGVSTAITATDSGTTLMKTLVPIIIGVVTILTMLVEALVM
jgi:hypothetical protein